MLLVPARRPSSLWVTKLLQLAIYYLGKIFFLRVRLDVHGISRLKNLQGNAIFAANHANELDPIVICLALEYAKVLRERVPLIFLSREKSFYGDMGFVKASLYGGFLFRLFGAYPVIPKNKRPPENQHRNASLETHISLLERGYSVIIFPEGTRTKTGELSPAKAGVAILSEQSGRSVVPIAIDGTFKLSFGDFWRGRKTVRVIFGAPMSLHRKHDPHALISYFSRKRAYIRKARIVMQCIGRLLASARGKDKG